MRPKTLARMYPWLALLALVSLVSCRTNQESRKITDGPMPDLTPTRIAYVNEDAFDVVLETALTNQDPVIIVQTNTSKPDWEDRLNAWIAAWNQGKPRPRFRGQSPLSSVPLDGDSIRELRILVGSLLDRAEGLAQSGASWWAEERMRSRRVNLLAPYSLRFHMDESDHIQLVFFHGTYSHYYPRFLQLLMNEGKMSGEEWSREVQCSHCKRKEVPALLTSRSP